MKSKNHLPRVQKVVAYVTREKAGRRELLVFTHRDFPEAGVQVPAGTVKDGEEIEAALWREVEEETGLSDLRMVRKLAVYQWPNPDTDQVNERHVFHLVAPEETADNWEWLETGGGEMADGFVFQFRWAALDATLDLAGNQGDWLYMLR